MYKLGFSFTLAICLAASLATAQTPAPDLYSKCSFYPQGAGCDGAYRQALKDADPAALAVRAAFQDYARYLKDGAPGLDESDRTWLKQNGIRLPQLNATNLAGLHNLLADPALQADQDRKRAAVNNFIGRAVQAELYCALNGCAAQANVS